jgi:hypothetical protein
VVSVEHNPRWHQDVVRKVAARASTRWQCFLIEADDPTRAAEKHAGVAGGEYLSSFYEYSGRTFADYVRVIDKWPDRSFDIVLVDGRARVSCIAHAAPKVKIGGTLILDNSERTRYRSGHELLSGTSWTKRRFFGPAPYGRQEFAETTFWTKVA